MRPVTSNVSVHASCRHQGRRQRSETFAMKVLVTGHKGYIGSVLVPILQTGDVDVVGLDSELFADCAFGDVPSDGPALRMDVRDVEGSDLRGFDAIIHLAA